MAFPPRAQSLDPMRRKTGERHSERSPMCHGVRHRSQESGHILRDKLDAQGRSKMIDPQTAEIFIEIPQRRRQRERLDAGCLRPFRQCRDREVAGGIVVPHDIKTSQRDR